MLVTWYLFCGILIVAVLAMMRGLTHSKFRDDRGDTTTEVGYEEDPVGHDLGPTDETVIHEDEPHVSDASSKGNMGLG